MASMVVAPGCRSAARCAAVACRTGARCRATGPGLLETRVYLGPDYWARRSAQPYEFIGFGDIYGPKPYEFIGVGDIYGPKPCEFIGFGFDIFMPALASW